ncbi:unnamed protein product [Amaranthus hypochondriacus]
MLIPGDLGFRVAVFFIFVFFPATFFLLRRKWRLAVARQEEINRLLVQASEEAAQAEIEASFGYSSSISISSLRVCAVCFTPTANRCARCKAVNYCSGKCQIIHWRQGHKDECHPSASSTEIHDEGYVGDPIKQQCFTDENVNSGLLDEEVGTAQENLNPTQPVFTPFDNCEDEKTSDTFPCEGDELEPQADLNGISGASQSHAFSSSDGMCIDDSSSDIDSLHDLNSDSSDSCSTPDNPETSSTGRIVEQTKPLEDEAYSRVESNDNTDTTGDAKEEELSKAAGYSALNTSRFDKNLSKPSIATSGFWEGTLDYCKTKKHLKSTNVKMEAGGLEDIVSDMHCQGLEPSSDTLPVMASTSKLAREPTSTEKDQRDPRRHLNSTTSGAKDPANRVRVSNSDGDLVKSGQVRATEETIKYSSRPLYASEKENDLDKGSKDVLRSLVSKKVELSSKSNGPSAMRDPIAPSRKSVKSSKGAAVATQVTPTAAVGLKTSVLKVVEQLRVPKLLRQGDDVVKNTEKVVFSYELFVKLYHWNKVELRPCGLINCGNSCYANVILQCLAFTPPLTAYLLQGLHSKACAKKEWCFLCEFERLILKAKDGGSALSPIGILSQIQKIGSHLSSGREEDAHEFLRYAIDTMQSTCLQEVGGIATGSLQEETNLLGLTFGGYLRSKIKCTKCRGKSEKHERMMDLTVEIGGDIETLEDALRKFTGTEPLDGENKYHCGRCKSYERAKKKLDISEAPNVLTIALKRFQSGKFGKLNKAIRFPEILNLAPYMRSGSDKSPIYRLYGVVVHLDIMNAAFSGHYVCYVRNAHNKWYKIDDSMVKAVELESVLNKGAYMLFYSRISPRAPKSIRSAMVCRDLSSKIKVAEVDASRNSAKITNSRQKDPSTHASRAPDNLASLGYVHQNGTSSPPVRNHILDVDSSSDNSSLFSHSDEVSSSTDSNRDSISADEFSEYIFGFNAFFRQSSDSETSSSSSCSSSPEYTRLSPLSSSERYASASPDDNAQSVPTEASRPVESGSFLHSNTSSKQVTKNLVNISSSSSSSSSRKADAEKLGWANSLDNEKSGSGVHLRRSCRKKSD